MVWRRVRVVWRVIPIAEVGRAAVVGSRHEVWRVWGVVWRWHEGVVLCRGELVGVQGAEGGTWWGHSWKTERGIYFHVEICSAGNHGA